MTVRGVLLDIDGTLVDSNDAHAEAFVAAFAAEGFDIAFDVIRPLVGMGSDRVMQEAAGLQKDQEVAQRIDEERKRYFYEECLPRLKPQPGAHDLLVRMKREGLKLVTASSSEAEVLDGLLRLLDAEDLIDEIAPTGQVQRSKPDPDLVLLALEKAGLTADSVVLLGDTPYDMRAAHAAGVAPVGVRCGGWNDPDLVPALAVYDDPADLLTHYDASPLAIGAPQTSG